MIFKIILIFSFLITIQSFAGTKIGKKSNGTSNQVVASAIDFKIVYGDKITYFNIARTKMGGVVKFKDNLGGKESKVISTDDFDFLRSKVDGFTEPFNEKQFCTRNYTEITARGRRILACIGAPNKLAKEVQKITNLIALLF